MLYEASNVVLEPTDKGEHPAAPASGVFGKGAADRGGLQPWHVLQLL